MTHRALVMILVVAVFPATLAQAQADVAGARDANRRGLRAHTRDEFEEAQALFQRAVELDPGSTMARFNLACATARLGDLQGAADHVAQYVRDAPEQAVRVLHDSDLEDLWKDDALLAALRAQIRPAGTTVREILFERREEGDLWAVSHDGLDVTQLTDTELFEQDVQFAMGGRFIVFRTLQGLTPVRVRYMLNEALPNQQLRVMEYPSGGQRTVDEGVYSYQLLEDGRTLLYPKTIPPSERHGGRTLPRILRKADVEGGEPETLGPVGFGRLCFALAPEGSAIVAEGSTVGWGTLSLTVARLSGGEREVLFERPPNTYRDFRHFTRCVLSDDGNTLDLGQMIVHLDGEVRVETASAEGLRDLYVTRSEVTHEDCEYGEGDARTPPPEWAVSDASWTVYEDMAECMWFSTTHVHRHQADGSLQRISGERTYIEYAPALAPQGDLLLRTRLRSRTSRPWLILSDPEGGQERPVVPGQFAVWSPHQHTVAEAGAAITFGPQGVAADAADEADEPIDMPVETGGDAPAAAADESDCGCAAPGLPTPDAGELFAFVIVGLLALSRRRRRAA